MQGVQRVQRVQREQGMQGEQGIKRAPLTPPSPPALCAEGLSRDRVAAGFFRKFLTSADNSVKIVLALMNVSLYGGVAQLGERCVRNA